MSGKILFFITKKYPRHFNADSVWIWNQRCTRRSIIYRVRCLLYAVCPYKWLFWRPLFTQVSYAVFTLAQVTQSNKFNFMYQTANDFRSCFMELSDSSRIIHDQLLGIYGAKSFDRNRRGYVFCCFTNRHFRHLYWRYEIKFSHNLLLCHSCWKVHQFNYFTIYFYNNNCIIFIRIIVCHSKTGFYFSVV